MLVTKLMSTQIVTVTLDTKLEVLVKLFANHQFHHLLVVEGHELVGVVSDRDLLRALHPRAGNVFATDQDNACLNKPVHQIMSRHPVAISEHESVIAAVKLINHHKVSVLPVVDNKGTPVGLLSWRDVFRGIERAYA